MGRHDKSKVRAGTLQFIHPHPPRVHVDCARIKRQIGKQPVRLPVGRILQRDPVPGPENGAQEHHQIIVSCADDDLVRTAVHPSGLMEITADRRAESRFPLGTPEPEQFRTVIQQTFPGKLPPCIVRETVQVNAVWREVIPVRLSLVFYRSLPGRLRGTDLVQAIDLRHIVASLRL